MSRRLPPSDGASPPRTTILVAGAASGGRLALVAQSLAPGQELPRHRHHWEDELVVVISGRLAAWIDGARVETGAGGAIFLPRGSEHALAAATAETRLLIAFTPAGFEGFFQELATGDGAADLERQIRVFAHYGVEVTGPPPSPSRARSRSVPESLAPDALDEPHSTPPQTTPPSGGPSW